VSLDRHPASKRDNTTKIFYRTKSWTYYNPELLDTQLTDQRTYYNPYNPELLDTPLTDQQSSSDGHPGISSDDRPYSEGVSELPTQYLQLAIILKEFDCNSSCSDTVPQNAGSDLGGVWHRRCGRIHNPAAELPLRRWFATRERHEVIACGHSNSGIQETRVGIRNSSPDQWHNEFRPLIQSVNSNETSVDWNKTAVEEFQDINREAWVGLPNCSPDWHLKFGYMNQPVDWKETAIKEYQHINKEPSESEDESSTSSISGVRRVFDERIKTLDPVLASCLSRRVAPKLHYLAPLFKGDGLLSLLEEDVANDGEQGPSSQETSPSTPANNGSSSGTNQGTSGPSKRPLEQGQGGDDNNKRSKRNKQNPTPRSLPPTDRRSKPRFKCPFYAKCCITHCRKNRKASKTLGYDTISHIFE
jgi:hypothetical protein